VKSKSDSVDRFVFTRETIPLNFITIRFETTEPDAFLKRSLQQQEEEGYEKEQQQQQDE